MREWGATCRGYLDGGKPPRQEKGTKRELRDALDTKVRTYGKVGTRGSPEAEGQKASTVNVKSVREEVTIVSGTTQSRWVITSIRTLAKHLYGNSGNPGLATTQRSA